MKTKRSITRVLCGALQLAICTAVAAGQYTVNRYAINGGGLVHSRAGSITISGTIGQPIPRDFSAGEIELISGFWFPLMPTDCSEDGVVSLFDHELLTACVTGPTGGTPTGSCECFDVNGNGHVDLADIANMHRVFGG